MKKITLKKLKLRNFKGVENLEVNFNEITNIRGNNGTGKTSIFDAFTWVLFGKNSSYESDFDIKPIDKETELTVHNIESEVTATFEIDSETIVLKRIYKEKWQTKRGFENQELTGHETLFYFNDVPISLGEYKLKIQNIIDEETFKVLTNPLYFNVNLKWNERRKILSEMVGEISNDSIIDSIATPSNDLCELINLLNENKNLTEEKKRLNASKKILKDELNQIPSRLDEVERNKPLTLDFEQIATEIELKEKELKEIDEKIIDFSKVDENQQKIISEKQNELFELKSKLNTLKSNFNEEKNHKIFTLQNELNDSNLNAQNQKNHLVNCQNDESNAKLRIEHLNKELNVLREEWKNENTSEFILDTSKTSCPTCKRELDNFQNLIEQLKENFNKNKIEKLEILKVKADEINLKINNENDYISKIDKTFSPAICRNIIEIGQEIQVLNDVLSNPEIESLTLQIENFIIPTIEKIEPTELIDKKALIKTEIDKLKFDYQTKFEIEKSENRIEVLKNEQKKLSQEIADIEKIEMQIEKFDFAKIQMIENNVNSKFKLVKFKMFENQLNGGIAETCIVTSLGKPFKAMNGALKINAGIDIINGLNDFYGFNLPLFIDERESTVEIIKTDCQVINLIVDENFETLNIK